MYTLLKHQDSVQLGESCAHESYANVVTV